MRNSGLALPVLLALCAGCLEVRTTACPSGLICPVGTTCDPLHDTCVAIEQIRACADLSELSECALPGGAGVCQNGLCISRACGDQILTPPEQCEPGLPLEKNCSDFGFYAEEGLACSPQCLFDVTACSGGICGDGVRDQSHEDCDGADVDVELSCLDFGFYLAPGLSCSGLCAYDVRACSERCGDDVVNGVEACDGDLAPGEDCRALGFDYGHASCNAGCDIDEAGCHLAEWRPAFGFDSLKDIFSAGPDDLYAVGFLGTIFHFDGLFWQQMSAPTTQNLQALSGSGPTSVFAVGDGGTVLHFDGVSWQLQDSGSSNALHDVYSAGPAHAVATDGINFLHYDGISWQSTPTGIVDQVSKLWGTGPNDVYAVAQQTLLHYDGVSWQPVSYGPPDVFISDVSGSGPNDVVVTGGTGKSFHYDGSVWTEHSAPFVLQYVWGAGSTHLFATSNKTMAYFDGEAWSRFRLSNGLGLYFLAVTGSGPTDVYALRNDGTIFRFRGTGWAAPARDIFAPISISGSGPADIFAVDNYDIRHFDGTCWQKQPLDGYFSMKDVWSPAPSVAFVVHYFGRILRYDGNEWADSLKIPSAIFEAIWGSGPDDVYAVGSGTIYHYDGSAWTSVYGTSPYLRDVWSSGPNDVFAVGGSGAGNDGKVVHYDGATFTELQVANQNLLGIWGLGPNDVFAVGSKGGLFHYDGISWAQVPIPSPQTLYDIWGSGPADIFAVGYPDTILHYDGIGWTAMAHPTHLMIEAVWGSGPTDVYAGDQYAGMLHYDGTEWRDWPDLNLDFLAVSAADAHDVFTAGERGSVFHYDGAVLTPHDLPTDADLFAITHPSADYAIAVGQGGTIATWNGSSWSLVAPPVLTALRAVWARDATLALAVGDGGVVLEANAGVWSPVAAPTAADLLSVWATATGDVFAVGQGGAIATSAGAAWTAMTSPTVATLRGVWGTAANDVFAVGDGGTILHYDGLVWTPMVSNTASDLLAVAGSSPIDVLATGENGVLVHYDGSTWAPITPPSMTPVRSISVTPTHIFFATSDATLLHLLRTVAWGSE